MSILSFISLVSAVVAMIMGVVVLQKTPRSKTQILYFCLSAAISIVAFAEYGFRQAESVGSARFWLAVSQMSPLIVPLITLFVGTYVQHPLFRNRFMMLAIMLVPAVGFIDFDVYTGLLSGMPVLTKWGWGQSLTLSFVANLYAIWSTGMLFAAALLAINFYRSRTNRQERNQAKIVAIAIATVVAISVILDIGMPYLHVNIPEFATLGYVIGNVLIAYAIRYHRLFVFSPVAAASTVLETMSDALFLVLPDGKIAHVNKAARKMFAIGNELVGDKKLGDFILADHVVTALGADGNFGLTEELFDHPAMSRVSPDVQRKTLSVAGKSMFDGDGSVLGTVVTVRDITDRVNAEKALKESNDLLEKRVQHRTHELHTSNEALAEERERLAVTLASIADGVITTDLHGNVVFMNKRGEVITGWLLADALGLPVSDLLKIRKKEAAESGEYVDPVAAILATGQSELSVPVLLTQRLGAERRVALSIAPICKAEGEMIGAVIVLHDVTEKERMEEELFKAKRLESVALLAGGIAHDFNNILTGINNNLFMCKIASQDPAAMVASINDAEREILRAKRLAMQLLTFAQGGEPILKVCSPRQLIEDSIGFFMSGSKSTYEVNFEDDLMNVRVDRGMMEQVLSNLLINAEQSMPEGGTIEIAVANVIVDKMIHEDRNSLMAMSPACSYVKITLRDFGAGIPEAIRDMVFDPFFSTKGKGRGLGLSIARSIIGKHGGTISINPDIQDGTAMVILLPGVEQSTQEQLEYSSQHAIPFFEPRGQKILLMDDEKTIRTSTTKILEMMGYHVSTAAHGDEAVALYREAVTSGFVFDCVLLDLTIPGGMGGCECLRELKKIDPGVIAIVSSGYSNDPVMAKYVQYGFAGVLKKPYEIELLDETIQTVIEDRCQSNDKR